MKFTEQTLPLVHDDLLNRDNPEDSVCEYCDDECTCDEDWFEEPGEPEEREFFG